MEDINEMPIADFRVSSAALWLAHHPLTGMTLIQTLRKRYGLNAKQAMEARELALELRYHWPIQGRWP